MERRVGQHHAELVEPGGDHGRDGGVGARREQHDRPLRRDQQRRRVAHLDEGLGDGKVTGHHGERLVGTVLATTQRGDGHRVRGVAGQVIAADPLDRHHPTLAQGGDSGREDRLGAVGNEVAVRGDGGQPGAAVVAGDRLGVVAAVGRVGVLPGAGDAHREAGHGGGRPVVGQVQGDGEPGPAVGAGDERVPVAAVGRVGQLGQAVGADGGVGGDQGALAVGGGGGRDREGVLVERGEVSGGDGGDPGQRRHLPGEPALEGGDGGRRPLGLDHHAGGVVATPAGDTGLGGQPGDVRTEADALHQPAHLDPAAHPGGRWGGRGPRLVQVGDHDAAPAARSQSTTRLLPESATARSSWWAWSWGRASGSRWEDDGCGTRPLSAEEASVE